MTALKKRVSIRPFGDWWNGSIQSDLSAGALPAGFTLSVNGTTYYFVTTSVDTSGLESVNSNEVKAVIPRSK